MTKLNPIVGYHGGKRRLLSRLRPLLQPSEIDVYVEPFAGMGAAYLDLRARGFNGPAVLCDANADVALFWQMVHEHPQAIICAAERLPMTPRAEDYNQAMQTPCDNAAARCATFLWITNYAFGNVAPRYTGAGWVGSGTKLTSAERWGKTFPWADCVARLRVAASVLARAEVFVFDKFDPAVIPQTATMYADPPYFDTRGYGSQRNDEKNRNAQDFIPRIQAVPTRLTVISEARDLRATLLGWSASHGEVTNRASTGCGASGKRGEWIYWRRGAADCDLERMLR